jgi:hypothetical protein
MTDIVEAVAKLSAKGRFALMQNCGCDSHEELVELGLWRPEFEFPSPYYITTPLGLQVRARLLADGRDVALIITERDAADAITALPNPVGGNFP